MTEKWQLSAAVIVGVEKGPFHFVPRVTKGLVMSGRLSSLATAFVVVMSWLAGPSTGQVNAQDNSVQGCEDCKVDPLSGALAERISGDLNSLAEQLSVLVSQGQARRLIGEQLTGAKQRTMGLHQLLDNLDQGKQQQQEAEDQNQREEREQDEDQSQRDRGQQGNRQQEGAQGQQQNRAMSSLLETVRKIEVAMEKCGVPTPRLDLKLPVEAHAKAMQSASEVYVAVVPFADEDQVRTVTAFANGQRVELSAQTPPETPTLVLVGAEPQSDDPGYPLPQSKEPGDEENPQRVDDYVGIPRMYINDDHESWLCGDPEIYVRVKRFRFSTFSILNDKVNLPGVNDEQVWYNLGDPNSTYKFVSRENYAPVVRIEVWEEDSGFHGGDDFLGATIIYWTNLPFGGFTEFAAGDARFRMDRD